MIFYGQRDKRWAQVTLGNTNRTVAQVGCTTCCVGTLASFFGILVDPGYLAKRLVYTPDALLVWSSLTSIGLKLDRRFYASNTAIIDEALKHPRKVVLLNVDSGAHWVSALRSLGFGTYWVHDPLTNSKKLYRGVVGGAVLSKI